MKATDGEMARIVTGSLLLLILTLVRSEESPVEGAVGTIKEKLQEIGANTQNKRAAVGGVLGFGAGMMIKQTQNMIITAGLLGGAATAGACYVGLVKPEDVEAKAGALLRKAESAVESTSSWFGPSPPIKIDSGTKLSLSRIYHKSPGFVAGAAAGVALGYKLG